MNRRGFVAWLGSAGVASFIGVGALARGAFGQGAGKTPPSPPPVIPPPATPEPPVISDDAKALHSILKARYGKELDEAQSQGLLEAIENGVQSGKALRAKKLANAVEPASVFHAAAPSAGAGK